MCTDLYPCAVAFMVQGHTNLKTEQTLTDESKIAAIKSAEGTFA